MPSCSWASLRNVPCASTCRSQVRPRRSLRITFLHQISVRCKAVNRGDRTYARSRWQRRCRRKPSLLIARLRGKLLGGMHKAPIWAGQFAYRSGPTERECSSSPRRSSSPQHTVGGDGLETGCTEPEELGSDLGEEGVLRGNIERHMGARPAPLACRVGGAVGVHLARNRAAVKHRAGLACGQPVGWISA